MNGKKGIFIIMLLVLQITGASVRAQYFNFSQTSFSEQRINPAHVARSDYAVASFLYRQQTAAEDFQIKSSFASLSMPFIKPNGGSRWSGIGLTFLDDRSGQNGIFQVQEIGLSYAIRVKIARNQSLYYGIRAMYESRQFSLNGLYTGTQYIPGRGFNTSLGNGETPDDFRQQFFTFSTGISWEVTQRDGTPIAQAGFALFDINKVDQSFFSGESVAPLTAILEGNLHLTGPTRFWLDPVALISFGQRTDVNLGTIWGYQLDEGNVQLMTRYVLGRYAIAGLQYERSNLALGVSYDIPIHDQVGNQGSFELGIKIKRLMKSKDKRIKREISPDQPLLTKSEVIPALNPVKPQKPIPAILPSIEPKKVVFYRSSEAGEARAGDLIYYPYVNENSTLTFRFDVNSTQLTSDAVTYLEDIARLLMDNPSLRIQITGHTDNVGEESYNEKLALSRARRIRDLLVQNGVESGRMDVNGKGEREPVAENDTEAGREKNRRVVFTIIR
jgi:type IX secretion system PorP/SprF family membrane protein